MKRRTFIATLLSLPFFKWLRPKLYTLEAGYVGPNNYEQNIADALSCGPAEPLTYEFIKNCRKKMIEYRIPPFVDENGVSYYELHLPSGKIKRV